MQWRIFCTLLTAGLSSSTVLKEFIGSRSLLKESRQRQLHTLIGNENEGRRKGDIAMVEGSMYQADGENALSLSRARELSLKSKTAYFFRGGQAMNKKEVLQLHPI